MYTAQHSTAQHMTLASMGYEAGICSWPELMALADLEWSHASGQPRERHKSRPGDTQVGNDRSVQASELRQTFQKTTV